MSADISQPRFWAQYISEAGGGGRSEGRMLLTYCISQIQLVRGSNCGFGLGPFICPFPYFGPWIFILDKNFMWESRVPDLLRQASGAADSPFIRKSSQKPSSVPIHRTRNMQQTTHGRAWRNCSGQSSHCLEDYGHLSPGVLDLAGTLSWVFGPSSGTRRAGSSLLLPIQPGR